VLPPLPRIEPRTLNALIWLYLSGDPTVMSNDLLGGFLAWLKAISLLCLVGWLLAWLVIGIKERVVGRGRWYDYIGVAALVLTPVTVLLRVLEAVNRIPAYAIGGIRVSALTALACTLLYVVWIEVAVGRTIARLGRRLDLAILVGVHLALALGLAVGL